VVLLLNTPLEQTGRRGVVERTDYLIDRFRVGYRFGGGWTCGCADFAKSEACRHTREGAGRRAAQLEILEHIRKGSLHSIRRDQREFASVPAAAVPKVSAR
jgi:hypothetical protein